jgi:hypothetical protein
VQQAVLFTQSEEQGFGAQMLHVSSFRQGPSWDRLLSVFYDFETTQNTKCTDTSFKHMPNLVCVQQF